MTRYWFIVLTLYALLIAQSIRDEMALTRYQRIDMSMKPIDNHRYGKTH